MTNRTAWTTGNGAGFTWASIFTGGSDQTAATTLATGNALLSSLSVSNQSSLDIYADISVRCTIASNTIAAGANIAFWLYALLDDGSTLGDGLLTAATAAAHTPAIAPIGVLPLFAAATQTSLNGFIQGIIIPPGTFSFVTQNNSGFAFTACNMKYRTYNLNLNN